MFKVPNLFFRRSTYWAKNSPDEYRCADTTCNKDRRAPLHEVEYDLSNGMIGRARFCEDHLSSASKLFKNIIR